MKQKLIGVLLALSSTPLMSMIDDGIVAQKNAFPAVVKIVHFQQQGSAFHSVSACTGTLISPKLVLTAAHCKGSPGLVTRVSLSGDERGGAVSHATAAGTGIQVIRTFIPTLYGQVERQTSEAQRSIKNGSVARLSQPQQVAFMENLFNAQIRQSSTDFAIMELESAQTISPVQIPELACDVLDQGEDVSMVGFGKNMARGSRRDLNVAGVMHYGHNRIAENANVYYMPRGSDTQMANKGDSGGPVFRRDRQNAVYGVISMGMNIPGVINGGFFGSTGSGPVKEFYREIVSDRTAPVELKTIVSRCL